MAKLNGTSYYLGLVGDHGTRRWNYLRPCDLARAHAAFQKPSYHVHSVIGKMAMPLMHAVDDASDPASRTNRLDVRFDKFPKLLGDCFGSET